MSSKVQKFRKSLGPMHPHFNTVAYRDLGTEMFAYITESWGYIGSLRGTGVERSLWEYYTHEGEIWKCTKKISQKQYLNLVKWTKVIKEFYEKS